LEPDQLIGFKLREDLDHLVISALVELPDDVGSNVRR